ncbi:hypothetical protein BH10PSE12_BH10PSE12_38220 [soil metagenome]
MQYRSMDHAAGPPSNRLFVAHSLLVVVGLLLLTAISLTQGSVIAVPLLASQRASGMADMIDAGARIVRAGPVTGSLVLRSGRNAIALIALRHGILLLPTTLAGCQAGKRPA